MRALANESMMDEDGHSCSLTAEDCGFSNNNNAEEESKEGEAEKPEIWAVPNKCETFGNIDYIGGGWVHKYLAVKIESLVYKII